MLRWSRSWWVSSLATGAAVAALLVAAPLATAQVRVGVSGGEHTKIKRVDVLAPGAAVVVQEDKQGKSDVDVAAPGVRVQRTREGVRIIAPLVDLFVPAQREQEQAGDKPTQKAEGQAQPQQERIVAERHAYLGVVLAPVPDILAIQFPDLLGEGGALITEVVQDSPAAKAGLKQYDVIIKFGDEKVKSPEDVVKGVLDAKPGTKVKITVLRGGKPTEIEVTLGERLEPIRPFGPAPLPRGRLRVLPGRPLPPQPQVVQPAPQRRVPAPARRFFELSISRENDRVSVKAAWAEDGQRKELALEGTVDEIRKQLEERKDVPEDVKRLILQNLEPRRRRAFRIVPFFGFNTDEGFFGGPMILFDEGNGDFRLWIDSFWPDPEEILRDLPPDTPPEIRQEIERALRRFSPPAPPQQQEKQDQQEPSPQPAPPPSDRVL